MKLFLAILLFVSISANAQITNVLLGNAPTGAGGDTARAAFTKVNSNFQFVAQVATTNAADIVTTSNRVSALSNSVVIVSNNFTAVSNRVENFISTNPPGGVVGTITNLIVNDGSGYPLMLSEYGQLNTGGASGFGSLFWISGRLSAPDGDSLDWFNRQFLGAWNFNNAVVTNLATANLVVGGGNAVIKILTATQVIDFPNTTANTHSTNHINVPGAGVTDVVSIGIPDSSWISDAVFMGYVVSTNTVCIRYQNTSNVSRDPPSGTFRVCVIKF